MYDDACYSHSMTFLIQFGKSTDLTFHNSYYQERALINHAYPWCVFAYTHTQYKCVLIPYNSLLYVQMLVNARAYETTLKLSGRGAFIQAWQALLLSKDAYLLYSRLDVGLCQWSMFHQCFFPSYFKILYQCHFGNSIFLYRYDYVFHLIILILDGCCEHL